MDVLVSGPYDRWAKPIDIVVIKDGGDVPEMQRDAPATWFMSAPAAISTSRWPSRSGWAPD